MHGIVRIFSLHLTSHHITSASSRSILFLCPPHHSPHLEAKKAEDVKDKVGKAGVFLRHYMASYERHNPSRDVTIDWPGHGSTTRWLSGARKPSFSQFLGPLSPFESESFYCFPPLTPPWNFLLVIKSITRFPPFFIISNKIIEWVIKFNSTFGALSWSDHGWVWRAKQVRKDASIMTPNPQPLSDWKSFDYTNSRVHWMTNEKKKSETLRTQ